MLLISPAHRKFLFSLLLYSGMALCWYGYSGLWFLDSKMGSMFAEPISYVFWLSFIAIGFFRKHNVWQWGLLLFICSVILTCAYCIQQFLHYLEAPPLCCADTICLPCKTPAGWWFQQIEQIPILLVLTFVYCLFVFLPSKIPCWIWDGLQKLLTNRQQ